MKIAYQNTSEQPQYVAGRLVQPNETIWLSPATTQIIKVPSAWIRHSPPRSTLLMCCWAVLNRI